ncbi:MAG: toll/interleukin-1 receptor domain-containing protein, partial [Bacteroidota bacterium]
MKTLSVFLSHNSQDKPFVEKLAFQLDLEKDLEPWLDKWNLIPGDPWQEGLEEALEKSDVCAVFIGPSGIGPWQNEEMRDAIDRRVTAGKGKYRVIPILLPGATREERGKLPRFLTRSTWVEFRGSVKDPEAYHRLLSGIRGIPPGPLKKKSSLDPTECPYQGLAFFDIEHAPFFYGRAALIEWLVNKLKPSPRDPSLNRFLAI